MLSWFDFWSPTVILILQLKLSTCFKGMFSLLSIAFRNEVQDHYVFMEKFISNFLPNAKKNAVSNWNIESSYFAMNTTLAHLVLTSKSSDLIFKQA